LLAKQTGRFCFGLFGQARPLPHLPPLISIVLARPSVYHARAQGGDVNDDQTISRIGLNRNSHGVG
jgi:hypothetical protein